MKHHPTPAQVPGENRPFKGLTAGQRHPFLVIWLVLMMLMNAAGLAVVPETLRWHQAQGTPGGSLPIKYLAVCMALNIIFAAALFWWRKWGFYGFACTSLVALGINLHLGIQAERVLIGGMGIFILFWALHLGEGQSAWNPFTQK